MSERGGGGRESDKMSGQEKVEHATVRDKIKNCGGVVTAVETLI